MMRWFIAGLMVLSVGCAAGEPSPENDQPVESPVFIEGATSEAEEEAMADPETQTEITRHRLRDPNKLGDMYLVARRKAESEITPSNAYERLRQIERAIDKDVRVLR